MHLDFTIYMDFISLTGKFEYGNYLIQNNLSVILSTVITDFLYYVFLEQNL